MFCEQAPCVCNAKEVKPKAVKPKAEPKARVTKVKEKAPVVPTVVAPAPPTPAKTSMLDAMRARAAAKPVAPAPVLNPTPPTATVRTEDSIEPTTDDAIRVLAKVGLLAESELVKYDSVINDEPDVAERRRRWRVQTLNRE